MLDLRSKIILRYLIKVCDEGSYKIVDIKELVYLFQKKNMVDEDIILQSMRYLENGEYISIKYVDDEQYCLCPLPFGRQFVENEDNRIAERLKIKKINFINNILIFISAFLGGFLAILFYNLIF